MYFDHFILIKLCYSDLSTGVSDTSMHEFVCPSARHGYLICFNFHVFLIQIELLSNLYSCLRTGFE